MKQKCTASTPSFVRDLLQPGGQAAQLPALLTLTAALLAVGCGGGGGGLGPTAPEAGFREIDTVGGKLQVMGCPDTLDGEIQAQVAEWYMDYPKGYGGTDYSRFALRGEAMRCSPTGSGCHYEPASKLIVCSLSVGAGGLAHELGHAACHSGFASGGVECATAHHRGGTDLFGKTCTRDGQAPASCASS